MVTIRCTLVSKPSVPRGQKLAHRIVVERV
jgi:hypothetical protein